MKYKRFFLNRDIRFKHYFYEKKDFFMSKVTVTGLKDHTKPLFKNFYIEFVKIHKLVSVNHSLR